MRLIRVVVMGLVALAAGCVLGAGVGSVAAKGQSSLLLGVMLILGIVGCSFGKVLRDWVDYRRATKPSMPSLKAFEKGGDANVK